MRLPLAAGAALMTPAQLAERFGVDEHLGRVLVVAALWELFEEAGVLLAWRPVDEGLVDAGGAVWAERRIAVEAHETSFTDASGDPLEAVDRRSTPEFENRRFGMWFFEALLPEAATAHADTSEAAQGRWTTPAALLAEADAGRARLMPPTRLCLERLLGAALGARGS